MQVLEILAHVNKRLKGLPAIQLPLQDLLAMAGATPQPGVPPAAAAMVRCAAAVLCCGCGGCCVDESALSCAGRRPVGGLGLCVSRIV